jgi:hypothetical protein
MKASVVASPEQMPEESIDLGWAPAADGLAGIVVDLPGEQSVRTGLALAKRGYRPVPLFNSVPAPSPAMLGSMNELVVIDMYGVVLRIIAGAVRLTSLNLPSNAPPAFLLDSRRRGERMILAPRMFDNRSVSLPTDFPSANFLISQGMSHVVVVQAQMNQPQQDLAHTLRRWQTAGLDMMVAAAGAPEPIAIFVQRPPWFRHLWYGVLMRMGLRRSPLGGFGGFIPLPSSG